MKFTEKERKYIEGSIQTARDKYYEPDLYYRSVPFLKTELKISRNTEEGDVILFGSIRIYLERLNKLKNEANEKRKRSHKG